MNQWLVFVLPMLAGAACVSLGALAARWLRQDRSRGWSFLLRVPGGEIKGEKLTLDEVRRAQVIWAAGASEDERP